MEVSYFYGKEAGVEAAATTDTVTFEYSLVNNGLLSVYNISMRDSVLETHGEIVTCKDAGGSLVEGSTPGVVSELASYPNDGLAPAAKLTCSATDSVFQAEVWTTPRSHRDGPHDPAFRCRCVAQTVSSKLVGTHLLRDEKQRF